MKKIKNIFLNAVPVLVMIGLIPFVKSDILLTFLYVLIIVAALCVKKEKNDILVFILGFIAMVFFESVFISTGVETFLRHSLFGIMPLWLPFLWGYSFIAIKRSVEILG